MLWREYDELPMIDSLLWMFLDDDDVLSRKTATSQLPPPLKKGETAITQCPRREEHTLRTKLVISKWREEYHDTDRMYKLCHQSHAYMQSIFARSSVTYINSQISLGLSQGYNNFLIFLHYTDCYIFTKMYRIKECKPEQVGQMSQSTRGTYPSSEREATLAVLWRGQIQSQIITGCVIWPKHIQFLKTLCFYHLPQIKQLIS